MIIDYLQTFLKKKVQNEVFQILNDGRAIFHDFGNDVYLSDQVNNCINRIAEEIGKIDVVSVVDKTSSIAKQNDEISRLFRYHPNPLQTTQDFLSSVEWLRRKDMNAFIYPQYDIITNSQGMQQRFYTAFWPLNPSGIEIGLDNSGKVWEIKFYFTTGDSYMLPYSDIVHLKWRRGKNMVIGGGNDCGMTDTKDLLQSVQTLDKTLQALPKSLESALKINGVYHAKTLVDAEKLNKQRQEFENHIQQSTTGIIATDLSGEFTPVHMTPPQIDSEVMKYLKGIIQQRYGISEAILSGNYTAEEHGAFYQSCIENFITEFEHAMTACLFSAREQDLGHRIKCYYRKVDYMTTQSKIEFATMANNTGLLTLNQIAEMFGYEPFEGGDRRLQSLNFVNTNIVDNYQLNQSGKAKGVQTKNE